MIQILNQNIELKFPYEPFYCGEGKMGGSGRYSRHRYSSSYDDTNNVIKKQIQKEILEFGLKPIVYIIIDNITKNDAKYNGEKMIIPKIGRMNHPDPSKKGSLCNRNDGGDGYAKGCLSKESSAKMSKSRKGNTNRCETWELTRLSDGYKVTTERFPDTCLELDLNKRRMWDVAGGRQKQHRGWICKNLTQKGEIALR